jgi:hypothetical protein
MEYDLYSVETTTYEGAICYGSLVSGEGRSEDVEAGHFVVLVL